MESSVTPPKNASPRSHRHPMRPVWITAIGLTVVLALTFVLFYQQEAERPVLVPSNVFLFSLIIVNVILVVILLLLLSRNLVKLYFERRHKLLGSGFRTKLVAAFVGFTLIPVILLFIVASGLINSSIENWFGIQVEQSLKSSLDVAQYYYKTTKDRTTRVGGEISQQIAVGRLWLPDRKTRLDQLLESSPIGVDIVRISIFNRDGDLIGLRTGSDVHADQSQPTTNIPRIDVLVDQTLQGEEQFTTISVNAGDVLRSTFPVYDQARRPTDHSAVSSNRVEAVVIVDSLIPLRITGSLDQIDRAMEDYRQLKTLKNPIKWIYWTLFLAVTLLIVFSATWFGFYIARGITNPIQRLVDGTRAVAAGDLTVHVEGETTDELNELIDSFNTMTSDLRLGQSQIDAVNQSLRQSNSEVEQRRTYIETVLEAIATGVIATDQKGRITTFNRSAETILETDAESVKGRHYEEVFTHHGLTPLIDDIHRLMRQHGNTAERDLQANIRGRIVTLRMSLSLMQSAQQEFMGAVLVFDDLSELLKAQKLAAWQEVARRIAHEIKNPLTPILLATERLRNKFAQNPDEFNAIFDESTRIVINEVNSLKAMVDEFSNYARMPMSSPYPCDLHKVIEEVVVLYRSAHRDIELLTDFAKSLPPVLIDPPQVKRVFVNLFENAVAAMNGRGRIWLRTDYMAGQSYVTIHVSDEGTGIPRDDLDKLFLPHFSKRHGGTGLGLAIVQRIVTDHSGHIRVEPNHPDGTTFVIQLPVPSPL